jgi:glycosyltransferase involved in cell wall biosynthesis
LNILHWPTSYPDQSRNQPYNGVFVQEHIKSTQGLANNRVLIISPENTRSLYKLHERFTSLEEGIPVTRYYFNKALNLTFLNVYIRLVIMVYFGELILVKKFYPNIIHIHFHQSFFWGKLYATIFRIPIIITEHWSAFLGWPNIGELRYKNAAKAFNYAKKILPVSLKIQKGITAYSGAEIEHKSIVITNTVDTKIFRYNKHNESKSSLKQLVFIGRNAEEKDIPTLMEGMVEIKKSGITFQLHIIGGGDYYPIDQLINQYNLENEIIQHGQLDKVAISKILQQSDLLLLTSIIENSPCVIGEAHCCGVPVVATDVGGISELILEGNLFEPKNANQLAEKIKQCLNKPINKEELSEIAAKRFGYENIGQQLYNVYKTVCAE